MFSESSLAHSKQIGHILSTGLENMNSEVSDPGLSNLISYVNGNVDFEATEDTEIDILELRSQFQNIIPYFCLPEEISSETDTKQKKWNIRAKELALPLLEGVDYLKHLTLNQ